MCIKYYEWNVLPKNSFTITSCDQTVGGRYKTRNEIEWNQLVLKWQIPIGSIPFLRSYIPSPLGYALETTYYAVIVEQF